MRSVEKARSDALENLGEAINALQDAGVDIELIDRAEQLLSEIRGEADHNCGNHFESYDHEFADESVINRGRCTRCGRELIEVYDLSHLVDPEISETLREYEPVKTE